MFLDRGQRDEPDLAVARLLQVLAGAADAAGQRYPVLGCRCTGDCGINQDLLKPPAGGRRKFRGPLYRLNVVSIVLPPLRHRGGDILLLAREFLRRFVTQQRLGLAFCAGVDASATDLLCALLLTGNVRQLPKRH